ncbi:hypothetical protein KIPB_003864, partial [Kipferlia bialata]|eukprot:g3864.t1
MPYVHGAQGNVVHGAHPFEGIPENQPSHTSSSLTECTRGQLGRCLKDVGHILVVGAGISKALSHNALMWGGMLEEVNDMMFRDGAWPEYTQISGRMIQIGEEISQAQWELSEEVAGILDELEAGCTAYVLGRCSKDTGCGASLLLREIQAVKGIGFMPHGAERSNTLWLLQRIQGAWETFQLGAAERRGRMLAECVSVYERADALKGGQEGKTLFDRCMWLSREALARSQPDPDVPSEWLADYNARVHKDLEGQVADSFRLLSIGLVLALDAAKHDYSGPTTTTSTSPDFKVTFNHPYVLE